MGQWPLPVNDRSLAGVSRVRFYETFGDFGFTMKCRMEGLRTFGSALSPFNAFLLLQGVETLPLRMERHCTNALAITRFRCAPPKKWPGSITPGGAEAGRRFIDNVEFLSHLANIGDAKTLLIHPASTTYRQLSETQQVSAGVPPDLIRLSVGQETLADIQWDIN